MVDNASSDGSTLKTAQKFPKTKIIYLPQNLGFSKAVNIGIKESIGDLIFITNDDFLFSEESLKILVDYLLKFPKIGVISGRVLFKPPKSGVTNSAWKINFFTGRQIPIHPNEPTEADWVSGACMLFKRSLIFKIGYFDEGFSPAYFEDVDFCFRAKNAGFKTIIYPKAIFYHLQEASISKMKYSRYLYLGQKSKIRFILKHANLVQIISFLLCQYLVAIPYRKIKSEYKNPLPEINALTYNLKDLYQILKSRKGV